MNVRRTWRFGVVAAAGSMVWAASVGLPAAHAAGPASQATATGALVTVGILWAAARALALSPREPRLSRAALLLAGLLIVQIGLGVSAYWMKLLARDAPQPLPAVVAVTTAHVAVGALVLAASLVLTLETYRLLRAPGQAGSLPRATLRTVTQELGNR